MFRSLSLILPSDAGLSFDFVSFLMTFLDDLDLDLDPDLDLALVLFPFPFLPASVFLFRDVDLCLGLALSSLDCDWDIRISFSWRECPGSTDLDFLLRPEDLDRERWVLLELERDRFL